MNQPDLATAYLDAFRKAQAPSPDAKARNLARLRQRLGANADAAEEETVAPVEPRYSRAASLIFIAKSASVSVLLGVIGLGAVKVAALGAGYNEPSHVAAEATEPDNDPAAPAPKRRSPSPTQAGVPVASAPSSVVATTTSAPTPPANPRPNSPAVAPKHPRPSASIDTTADALRAEVELMRRGSAALEAKQWRKVLALTQEHANRFPKGVMLEERRAWFALASCALDPRSGQSAARVFAEQHPRSALLAKVRTSCKTIPTAEKMETDSGHRAEGSP